MNYKELAENAGVGVYQNTLEGEFLYANQAFLDLFEFESLEKLKTVDAKDFYVHPEQRKELLRLIQVQGSTSNFEVELKTQTGNTIWVFLDATRDGDLLSGMIIDITARHHAEEEVKNSELWFRSIWENSKDGMRLLDSTGIIIDVNEAYCQLIQYKREELIGQPFTVIYDDTVMNKTDMQQKFVNEFNTGESDVLRESDVTLQSGQEMFLQVTNSLISLGNRKVLLSIFRDMTDRNLIEEKLKLRSSALNAAANGIIITDKNGIIEWVNPAVSKLTGYTKEEIIGKNPNILKSGVQGTNFYQELWKTIESGQVWFGEIINKRKDGSLYPEEMTITPVTGEDGSITHYIAIKHDITNRKESEKALKDSERNLRQLVENMQEGIFRVTEHGIISFINQQLVDIVGYNSTDDLLGANVYTAGFSTGHQIKKFLSALKEKGSLRNYQIVFTTSKGKDVHVKINAVTVRDDEGNVLYYEGTVDDITEQKTLESQLMQAQKMEALGHIAGGIAHDFNNVMAAISGANHMLYINLESPKLRKYTSLIKSNIERGRSVTERMLTFTRSHKPNVNTISLSELLYTVSDILAHTLPKKVQIEIHPFEGNGGLVDADRGQMQQVLLNLCINASDAMPDGGTITLTINDAEIEKVRALPLDSTREYLCITVKDDGIGIQEDNLDNIFEPFFTTKDPGKGTGLGLSVVYKIIKNHGGTIDVKSKLGFGTTFFIYLPVSNNSSTSQASTKILKASHGRGQHILLVEDEESIRELLSEWLRSNNFQLTVAKDAAEALSYFNNGKPHFELLLTDIGLPGMNGVELAKRVKQKSPGIKIIASTGYVDESEQKRLKEIGFADVVRKPFDFQNLLQTLITVLN